ncbi:MAG: reverse transcriptase family protein, partial [Candidatus Heimdallarchaeaceae archaeon]
FVQGKSIFDNAKAHRKNKVVIKFDIKDFFPSITFPRVRGMFMQFPFNYSKEKSTALAQICCLENSGPIPQGAITSPYISNMICRKLDSRLAGYAIKSKLRYSRYADDMVFSSNFSQLDIQTITKHIHQIIEDEGFVVNEAKTKVLRKNQPQTITGILVNEGLNVRRTYIRNIRAMLYKCERSSVLTQAIEYYERIHRRSLSKEENVWVDSKNGISLKSYNLKDSFLAHLEGRIQFYGSVARANKGLNESHYKTRIALYDRLMDRLRAVGKNESTRRDFAMQKIHAHSQYSDIPETQLEIESIKQMNEGQLDSYIREKEQLDIRFYIHPVTSESFEGRQNKVIGNLQSAELDQNRTLDIFRNLQDSRSNVLGRLVHEGRSIEENELIEYTKSFMEIYPLIPIPLANLTENLLRDARRVFESIQEKEHDFWANTRFRERNIFEYMQRIRFQKMDINTGTKLIKNIAGIANSLEKDISPEERRIVVEENLSDQEFYTDVANVSEAIRDILRSMLRNSKGDKIFIVTRRRSNSTLLVICDNNKAPHWPTSPTRSQAGHGKIRSATRKLYGLGSYSIISNCTEGGWRSIDMFSGEVLEDTEKAGYMHMMEFPQL